jgi:predicted transcriptional regulator
MRKEQLLNIESRRKIYNYVAKNPGLHFREVVRDLKIPKSTLNYHMLYLKKHGFLEEHMENGYRRFYSARKMCEMDKRIINVLRQSVPRNIILYLTLFGPSSQTEILKFAKKWKNHPSKLGYHLNKHHTTISFHIKKLVNMDILESTSEHGYEAKYDLKNPGSIFELMILYEKSLLDEATNRVLIHYDPKDSIDKFVEIFYDIFPNPYCC